MIQHGQTQAHRDHFWHVSYADTDWDIATYEEPGTVKNIHDPRSADEREHSALLAELS